MKPVVLCVLVAFIMAYQAGIPEEPSVLVNQISSNIQKITLLSKKCTHKNALLSASASNTWTHFNTNKQHASLWLSCQPPSCKGQSLCWELNRTAASYYRRCELLGLGWIYIPGLLSEVSWWKCKCASVENVRLLQQCLMPANFFYIL